MKKILISFLAIGALVCSCEKQPEGLPEGTPVEISVDVRGQGATKATGIVSNSADTEAKVNTLQVFVFSGNTLDGYGTSTNSLTATVKCSSGEREIWAVVNGEDLSHVTTKQMLMNETAQVYSGVVNNFTMAGSKTHTITAESTVTIDVARLVARVVIRGIKNVLENAVQADDFKINEIYLTNVAGDCDFGKSADYEVANWYHKQGYDGSNTLGQVIFDEVNTVVAANSTYSVAHYFYAMPNRFDSAVGGSWSPRATKLVVKATINGDEFFYPVTLPVLQSNKSYEINLLTLTRSGNSGGTDDDEEKPIIGIDGFDGVTINVLDWTVVLVGDSDGNITI